MALELVWTDQARDELDDIVAWYEQRASGIGVAFYLQIFQQLELRQEFPEASGIVFAHYRRLLIDNYPYGIFYEVIGNTLVVLRILHLHRDVQRSDLEDDETE